MEKQQMPRGAAQTEQEKPERTVTILNHSTHLRTIDFGEQLTDAEGKARAEKVASGEITEFHTGPRRRISIPRGKLDGLKTRVEPGRLEKVPLSDWEAIKVHPTAKHMVMDATLTMIEE